VESLTPRSASKGGHWEREPQRVEEEGKRSISYSAEGEEGVIYGKKVDGKTRP